MSFSPRPPKSPSRAREVVMQVVRQEKSGAVNPHLIVVEEKQPDVAPPRPDSD
jgi:hypothetical protein